MATYCVRRYLSLLKGRASLGWQKRKFADSARSDEAPDPTAVVTDLCRGRHFITGEQVEKDSLLAGWHGYGPLGMVLRRNLAEQWWRSMTTSRGQVFGLSTLHQAGSGGRKALKLVDGEALAAILKEKGQSVEQLTAEVERLLRASATLRTELLQGALEQYTHCLSLVNRKLPFGLAEMGVCYQPAAPDSEGTTRGGDVGLAGVVQLPPHRWTVAGLLGAAQAAVVEEGASNFSSSDFQDECGTKGTRLYYSFPWGREPIETLQSLGDRDLLETHQGNRAKLQCRDGRKTVIPHVLSVSGNMDRGLLAYLFDSLQQLKKVDSKQRLHQRKVLKLHPSLAPVKVALDMGRGPTLELRQVCEGLLQELLEEDIAVWPGYLETMQTSLEQLHSKYDEMGVLFTILLSDSTLENGLIQLRNRDTSIKEVMHISHIKNFLIKYILAAENV
ncbi:DNA polymerase subunit gamma-2, mitochondrial [Acipenser ruthenus]|uniref:DNA polymerase subunit gamma-2, mitochondrial n=1 Tax=Acipenser ruthenus TaxID=7906 RepID=A0A662YW89_ACIRT|nr:DNA polymerase subunit gamma-2, mitochondrial [Acipenser ruthenus]